jgi:hypothetical protein
MRLRVAVSLAIGLLSGLFCWFLLHKFQQGAADFQWAIRGAQSMLAGRNPYDTPLEQYPMTAALFALPFLRLLPEIAAGTFFGISSGLLAFGLTGQGYVRLFTFLAFPYWAAILTAQWSPLVTASAFFPLLLPVALAKPQIGLPVAATHLTRRGIIACLAWFLLSLALMPTWPLLWWKQLGNYQHFIPMLVLPGPLLALALLRYRDRDTWLLLTAALMPQRYFFDSLILWLIPKSRRELLGAAALSWIAGVWRWYHPPTSFTQIGRWAVLFIYLPMLVILLARGLTRRDQPASS